MSKKGGYIGGHTIVGARSGWWSQGADQRKRRMNAQIRNEVGAARKKATEGPGAKKSPVERRQTQEEREAQAKQRQAEKAKRRQEAEQAQQLRIKERREKEAATRELKAKTREENLKKEAIDRERGRIKREARCAARLARRKKPFEVSHKNRRGLRSPKALP
jgi:hypothetical protein